MHFGYADTGSIEPGRQAQGLLRPAVHQAAPAQGPGELLAGGEGRGRWWVVGLAHTGVLPRGCDGVGGVPETGIA